jgi:hypothetical protein
MSRQLCYGSHSSIVVGHDLLDELVLFIQCHMADIMIEVAFSTSVTSLATAIAGLRDGLEGLSAVDVHWNTRGECMRRGMHCCRGRGGGRGM